MHQERNLRSEAGLPILASSVGTRSPEVNIRIDTIKVRDCDANHIIRGSLRLNSYVNGVNLDKYELILILI